jgi:hypothetical protein
MLGTCSIAPPGGWGSRKPPPGVRIDRSHPIVSRLQFYLPFNEYVGTVANDLAMNPVATITNGAWNPGLGTLGFSGSGYAALGRAFVSGAGDWSIAGRWRATPNVLGTIYATRPDLGGTPGSPGWGVYTTTLGRAAIRYDNGSITNGYILTSNWTDYLLHSVAVVLSGNSKGVMYIDGISQGTVNMTAWGTVTDAVIPKLASNTSGTQAMTGDFQWFGLWSRALSATEILQLHAQSYGMFDSGMLFAGAFSPLVSIFMGAAA